MCNLTSEAELRSKFLSSVFQLLLSPNKENCHSSAKTQSHQKKKKKKLEVRRTKRILHIITQRRAKDEGKRNERRDHSVKDQREAMMVRAVACILWQQGSLPSCGRVFLYMGLFLAPKDLEFPLELGMKSNKSVCLCLLFVLHLPLFRGPTLPLLLQSLVPKVLPFLPPSQPSPLRVYLSMQSCLGVEWLFMVSCSFVILCEELPG